MPERGPVAGMADFEQGAGEVLAAIERGPLPEAAGRLAEFANRHAAADARRDDALLLALECRDAGALPPPAQQDIRQRLRSLLDQLGADFRSQGGMAALAARATRDAELRERLLREAPPREVVLQCRGLEKRYSGSEFHFGTLDLTLRAGEIAGVVGENGYGKTTLLRMAAGELQQDAGEITFPMFGQQGPRTDWVRVKRELSYVPQELPPWRGSLADMLHFEASMHGIRGAENEREVRILVERLGLAEHLGKRWNQLSGGFKLRFALARALVSRPRLLVMDEPLANLDQRAKGRLLRDVRDLARSYRRPMAVLMSSHDLHGLERVCSTMVFLRNGKVEYAGPAAGIPDLARTRLADEFEVGTPLTLEALRERLADSMVTELREDGVSLIISARRGTGPAAMLRLLLERGVEIEYFRDISRSVSRLFG